MNCHIVPQVYLKQWKIPSSSNGIYVFDKNNIENGVQKNISNLSDTSFAIKNYYVLDEAKSSHQFTLTGTTNLSVREKNIIETDYFAHHVEKNWRTFLDYVNYTFMNENVTKTTEQYKNEFLEFLTIQLFNVKNHPTTAVGGALKPASAKTDA